MPRVTDQSRADQLVSVLALEPHPEGGLFRQTWVSPATVTLPDGRVRPTATLIYFLLPAGTFSAFHRVTSDEVWHHYDGDAVELHLIEESGAYRMLILGRDIARGEQPQVVVPAGVWQAAVPVGERHALCGCTVAPGFDFADFAMPPRAEMVQRFPQHRAAFDRLSRE